MEMTENEQFDFHCCFTHHGRVQVFFLVAIMLCWTKSHILTALDQFQFHISQNQESVARQVNISSSNARSGFPKQVGGQTKQGAKAEWKCLTRG